MNNGKTASVYFLPTYLLTLTKNDKDWGSIQTVGASPSITVNLGATSGTEPYNSGTTVSISATPASGYTFTGWSGACTGSGACSVTMDAIKTVTANFQLAYINCGLKAYDGTQTIIFACEPTGTVTSPLRISKGGTTYGIMLVDPANASASKFKIQTNAGIKALMKL